MFGDRGDPSLTTRKGTLPWLASAYAKILPARQVETPRRPPRSRHLPCNSRSATEPGPCGRVTRLNTSKAMGSSTGLVVDCSWLTALPTPTPLGPIGTSTRPSAATPALGTAIRSRLGTNPPTCAAPAVAGASTPAGPSIPTIPGLSVRRGGNPIGAPGGTATVNSRIPCLRAKGKCRALDGPVSKWFRCAAGPRTRFRPSMPSAPPIRGGRCLRCGRTCGVRRPAPMCRGPVDRGPIAMRHTGSPGCGRQPSPASWRTPPIWPPRTSNPTRPPCANASAGWRAGCCGYLLSAPSPRLGLCGRFRVPARLRRRAGGGCLPRAGRLPAWFLRRSLFNALPILEPRYSIMLLGLGPAR